MRDVTICGAAEELCVSHADWPSILEASGTDAELQALLRSELASPGGAEHVQDFMAQGMASRNLSEIARLAANFAQVRWGVGEPESVADPARPPLTRGKLSHDLAQLRHLRKLNKLGTETDSLIDAYRSALDTFSDQDSELRRQIDAAKEPLLDRCYGRIVYLDPCEREPSALSGHWSRGEAEHTYITNAPGIVVIDDFLSSGALQALRRFCQNSTVWHRNRYARGRLGAFFLSGFACPLLAQVSEELRAQLPRVIGDHHPLRQLWGFKYPPQLPADSTIHADFAAVNVNFWISPDAANNDPERGGLVIYEHDAPAGWGFNEYNARMDLIKRFLERKRSRWLRIPYRENRAIIFNSDLFHATDKLDFRPDFSDQRINITMLYGDRRDDRHHPNNFGPTAAGAMPLGRPAWRSAALRRRP